MIKMLFLLTGEEIIGEITTDTNEYVKIKNPLKMVVYPNKLDPTSPKVGLGLWQNFTDDTEFKIQRTHIVTEKTPIPEFVNQYKTVFGGLVVPEGPSLILP